MKSAFRIRPTGRLDSCRRRTTASADGENSRWTENDYPSTSIAEVGKTSSWQAQEDDENYSGSESLFDWPDHGFITPFLQVSLDLVHLTRAQHFILANFGEDDSW